MEREVEDFIQKLSDIDLLEYTHTKIHLPEAIEFAKIELARRKKLTVRDVGIELLAGRCWDELL